MQHFANLSGTVCPYCDINSTPKSDKFEIVQDRPANSTSDYLYYYLRCTKCKRFLAILPADKPDVLIKNLMAKKGL